MYPAAGPYYIASRDQGRSTVLKRNPYYKGARPANPDQIVFTAERRSSISRCCRSRPGSPTSTSAASRRRRRPTSAKTYGVNKGRFFVGATSCVNYMAHEHARAPFNNVNLRKAVNWAIDRPAQVRLLGAYAGKRTDQILVPGVPGYKPFNVYALKGADVAKAKQIGGSAIASSPTINFVHTHERVSTNRAQVAEYNLRQVGFKINDVPTPATNYYQVIQTRDTDVQLRANGGWCADYFDPFDYLNVLFDGRKHPGREQQQFYAYFNNASLQRRVSTMQPRCPARPARSAYAEARPGPDGQVRTGRAVPHRNEPVLRRLAREELDLQLVLRLAVLQRSGGRLAVTHVTGRTRLEGRLRAPLQTPPGSPDPQHGDTT